MKCKKHKNHKKPKMRLVVDNKEKGMIRYCIIRDTIKRYNQSINAGFYLEAITLMESLIADRLESHICCHNPNFTAFKTLEHLIHEFENNSSKYSPDLVNVCGEIERWKDDRNHLLHELAKIDATETHKTFAIKYSLAESCAKEGKRLFDQIKKVIEKERRDIKKPSVSSGE